MVGRGVRGGAEHGVGLASSWCLHRLISSKRPVILMESEM